VIGIAGGDNATVLDGTLAVSFVETTPFGGIVVTTIDKRAISLNRFTAAMAKQLPLTLGGFHSTQYYGACRGQS
jgi:hypothetical protein